MPRDVHLRGTGPSISFKIQFISYVVKFTTLSPVMYRYYYYYFLWFICPRTRPCVFSLLKHHHYCRRYYLSLRMGVGRYRHGVVVSLSRDENETAIASPPGSMKVLIPPPPFLINNTHALFAYNSKVTVKRSLPTPLPVLRFHRLNSFA